MASGRNASIPTGSTAPSHSITSQACDVTASRTIRRSAESRETISTRGFSITALLQTGEGVSNYVAPMRSLIQYRLYLRYAMFLTIFLVAIAPRSGTRAGAQPYPRACRGSAHLRIPTEGAVRGRLRIEA